jgi:hypothetical protein
MKLFGSYRRDDDGSYFVPELTRRLTGRYGDDSVFYDIDRIPLGVDFRDYLSNAIASASVVLVVMGDRWVGYDAQTGMRRIDREDDFVRIEVEAALNRSIPVVPVLVGRAVMPCERELPDSLAKLAYRNAAEVRTGKDYELHMAELLRGLDAIMQSAEHSIRPPTPRTIPPIPVADHVGDRQRARRGHADGSVVFHNHRQVWVGYAVGRIVCTKDSADKAMVFLKDRFDLDGVIVEDSTGK